MEHFYPATNTKNATLSPLFVVLGTPLTAMLLGAMFGGALLLTIPQQSHAQADAVKAEVVKAEMQSLFEPLKKLQPYLADQSRFCDPAEKEKVLALVRTLRSGFHTVEAVPSRYHQMPGFDFSVKQVSTILDDAEKRLSEGKAEYAWWRVRVLPGACFSCHATYNVTSVYSDTDTVAPSLGEMDRARFFLATRQFTHAETVLKKVLADPAQRFDHSEALRSLLTVELRVRNDFSHTQETIRKAIAGTVLPEDDVEEAQGWIATLGTLKKRTPPAPAAYAVEGERLITAGLPKSIDGRDDTVLLLSGTALLHKALEGASVPKGHRQRVLFLLGAAYSRLPLFFAESWSTLYLEQCITEYPGTAEAKQSFRVYKEIVSEQFTGSGGTQMPAEVALQLEDLRKKAYNIPSFNGKS